MRRKLSLRGEMPLNISMGRIRPRAASRAEIFGEILIKNSQPKEGKDPLTNKQKPFDQRRGSQPSTTLDLDPTEMINTGISLRRDIQSALNNRR